MGCTVQELEDRVSYAELIEWEAYFEIEPFGPVATNVNFGKVISAIMNAFSSKKSKRVKPQDVMLGEINPQPKRKQSPEDMLTIVQALASTKRNK